MWRLTDDYINKVEENWNIFIEGVLMYRLVKKLKRFKVVLKEINYTQYADIEKEDKKSLAFLKIC